tara:strand:- start:433 stop:624 length:192 start_codon:yes stop_codon:yes gene_type:complete
MGLTRLSFEKWMMPAIIGLLVLANIVQDRVRSNTKMDLSIAHANLAEQSAALDYCERRLQQYQ